MSIPDTSYEAYNTRAAAIIAMLNREGSTKSADLAAELTGLIGSDSPRLIAAIHRAEAKFSARQLRDALGRWTDTGAAASLVNGPPLTVGRRRPAFVPTGDNRPKPKPGKPKKPVNMEVSMAFTQIDDALDDASSKGNPNAPELQDSLAEARKRVEAALEDDAPFGAVSRAQTALRNFESDAQDAGLDRSHPDEMDNLKLIREQLRGAAAGAVHRRVQQEFGDDPIRNEIHFP